MTSPTGGSPEGIAPTLRSHRIRLGLYDLVGGRLSRRDSIELDVVGASTEVPQLAGVRQPDLLLLNDDDLTFAKIRLDARSWQTAVQHLGDLDNSLARALVWGAAWDMTRDAEVSTGDYLSLVLGAIGRESDIGVVGVVLRQLRSAIDQFAAPDHRDGYRRRLADGMLELARAAAPGSDHQLTFTRVFAGVARSPEHLRIVAGLLDGSIVWEGLAVDTDLRWHLLEQLVTAGAAEDDAIEAELARDDTATGRRRAAFARAARPTSVAKELAWADVMDRSDLPNAMLEATMGGFVQPEQLDLLRPYRARYFEALPRVWEQRTMEMAQDITSTLYPFLLVDDETLRLTDAYLTRTDLAAAQRRLLIEGRDAVVRAQRAQARDAV